MRSYYISIVSRLNDDMFCCAEVLSLVFDMLSMEIDAKLTVRLLCHMCYLFDLITKLSAAIVSFFIAELPDC